MNFIDLTVMNKLTKEMNNGFQELIVDTSKADRVLQCRDCNSVEIHNPKFFSLHGETCKKGCGFGFSSEDLVPLPIKCRNCGNQKGFDFPDDSGVEEAELANHEMYAKAKASMLEENLSEDYIHVLSDIESEIAEATQLAENSPEVKGEVVQQVFTIEPREGFESSGFIENDAFHKGNIHETCYAHLVNPGNTPHMQKKIPIEQLLAIRKSTAQAMINIWEPKTYGDREINAECKSKMGFSIECLNEGDRKLSDQKVKRLLTSVYFARKNIEELLAKDSKLTMDEKKLLDDSEETVGRIIAVLKTGDNTIGQQSPMYDVKINTYDPVDLVKLQMELDIPWNEEPMDTYKLFKTQKNKARARKAAKTRAANKLKRAESQ